MTGFTLKTAEYGADADEYEGHDPAGNDTPARLWHLPGYFLANDGVSLPTLSAGDAYTLDHDGTGWLFTTRGDSHRRYLMAGDEQFTAALLDADPDMRARLRHITALPGDRLTALDPACSYTITLEGSGWRVRAAQPATP